jgi:RimJ/RimL family protein N-acetyltransferase
MPVTLRRRPRMLRGIRMERPVDAPVLHTERTTLRPHRIEDAEAWHRLHADAETRRFLEWPERDAAAARWHLLGRTRRTRLWQTDDFLALAVEVEGRLAGDVSLHLRSVRAAGRTVEIGWVLAREFTGKGLASEAVRALLDFAFGDVGACVVVAEIHHDNRASIALAERLGFVLAARDDERATYLLTREMHLGGRPGDRTDAPERRSTPNGGPKHAA